LSRRKNLRRTRSLMLSGTGRPSPPAPVRSRGPCNRDIGVFAGVCRFRLRFGGRHACGYRSEIVGRRVLSRIFALKSFDGSTHVLSCAISFDDAFCQLDQLVFCCLRFAVAEFLFAFRPGSRISSSARSSCLNDISRPADSIIHTFIFDQVHPLAGSRAIRSGGSTVSAPCLLRKKNL